MVKAFKTVLVPVDFSLNTEVAIAKTLALTNGEESVIHLLHVFQTSPFADNTLAYNTAVLKLKQWKETIEECHETMTVYCQLREGSSVQKTIRQVAEETRADVIVIAQTTMHASFFFFKTVWPMKLAAQTATPVLTVKPGALHRKIKTVVVPISDNVPEGKLNLLTVLCKRETPTIHLVAFGNDKYTNNDHSASALLQVYQWLKTTLHCRVVHGVVQGSNKAKAILDYAEKTNADLLLVQPLQETRIGWRNRQIPDVLPRSSSVQVLAVGA